MQIDYEISGDAARVQLDVVHAALAASYWSPGIRREVLANAVAHSLVIGAFVSGGGAQVGFARVVTDQATFAWLCDVWVAQAHRGAGLGTRMVGELIAHPNLQTLRRWCLATRDAHGLYTKFAFAAVPAQRWMEKLLEPKAWQQTAI